MGEEIFGGIEMNKLNKCEICMKENFEPLYEGEDKNLGIAKKFKLDRCKNCKIIFLNPQPSFKDLEEHYSSEKYYSLRGIKTKENKKIKQRLFLYGLYFGQGRSNFIKKILFSPIKFLIRGIEIEKDKKLLDVGCGSGQFLYEMKQFGMRVEGVEPGNFDEKIAKENGIKILKGDLLKIKYPKESFDIITLNHVLEHVDKPNEIISEINRLLKSKGKLIVGVPNSKSLAHFIFKKNWHQLDIPRHLFNFSDKNLKQLLEKHFKINKIRYNSRPNQFVTSLYFLLGIKKRQGVVNKILDVLFLPLTWLVNSLKIGDQIEVWCEKKS
jgi:2-polyprenyl-3-methyl-5-hydroxy-6-metoxy-1,4-benzoquinol methylase